MAKVISNRRLPLARISVYDARLPDVVGVMFRQPARRRVRRVLLQSLFTRAAGRPRVFVAGRTRAPRLHDRRRRRRCRRIGDKA